MNNCLYYTALDVAELLGVSRAKAYKIVKTLNEELKSAGYLTISGKVPKKYFCEKCYGIVPV